MPLTQSREVNEDRDSSDGDNEGFRDVEEIMETAMSLKERRQEYRKLLAATTGGPYMYLQGGAKEMSCVLKFPSLVLRGNAVCQCTANNMKFHLNSPNLVPISFAQSCI